MKTFYNHLVILDDILQELDAWEIDASEKEEIVSLIEQTLHHHTLNIILNHLPENQHDKFLDDFEKDPENSELMTMLKAEIKADIESAIKTQAEKIKKEILTEIRRSKKV